MELISLTSRNIQNTVETAARILKKGGVVVAPTDTVYGLIADATNDSAIKKIYAIKKRSREKPLPVFVKNMAMANKFAEISQNQRKILEEKWPGKVTAILRRKHDLKIFGVAGDTIALRIPFYHFINSLLETLDSPLAGTSANISGKPASTKIDDIIQQFLGLNPLPDIFINAGDLADSKSSTIIDMTKQEIKIIRA
ncbi:MAG: L-threonylcarbamoyladenylate synthase [Candidatus Paceibacterota bacterium]